MAALKPLASLSLLVVITVSGEQSWSLLIQFLCAHTYPNMKKKTFSDEPPLACRLEKGQSHGGQN